MFADLGEEQNKPKQRFIYFILNGKPEKLFTHTFIKPLTRVQIEELCEAHWQLGRKSLRFFSLQGVEVMEEELMYVRNGARIYISKGQDFDSERNFGQYKLLEQLGEGGFGKVWLARSSINQELAAIKLIKLEKITGARDIDMAFREVENLKALSHPNIVRILNCYTLSNMQLVVVMEYLEGGELIGLLKKRGNFTEIEAREIFAQIVSAISYCHQQNIIHRDLKLENILVANKEELRVKIADFGISGVADSFNPDFDIGTLRYMAPEVLSKKEKINTAGVDVWACGVMLFCMLFGYLPFTGNSNSQTIQAIVSGEFDFPSKPLVSQEGKSLIRSMLTVDPKLRISISDVQNHLWMNCDFTIIVEEQILKLPRSKIVARQNKRITELKRTAVIPKRLEKEKQQLIEELKNLGSPRRKANKNSGSKPLRVGSMEVLLPRYMRKTKCREDERESNRKRVSIAQNLWK